jgi:hypothetical protein
MKYVLLSILLLGLLIACGRADQPSLTGGSGTEITSGVVYLPPRESTPFPSPTTYVPILNGTMVEIDALVLSHRPHVAFTLQDGQVVHLIAAENDVPFVEWFIEADPLLFEASIDGQLHTPVEGFEPYPSNGLVLTPLKKGKTSFRLNMRFMPCEDCEISTTYTVYEITVN